MTQQIFTTPVPGEDSVSPKLPYDRVAFSGSRSLAGAIFHELGLVFRQLDPNTTTILVGDARGVDKQVANRAKHEGFVVSVWLPNWRHFGRGGGIVRNERMLRAADALFAFWDGSSRGTMHAIEEGKRLGLPVVIYEYERQWSSLVDQYRVKHRQFDPSGAAGGD